MNPFKPIWTVLVILAIALCSAVVVNHAQGVVGNGIYEANIAYGGSATIDPTNSVYVINATASTATLPTAVGIRGRIFTIKTQNFTGTVATALSEKIDGSSTYTLSASNKMVRLVSDGTNWINIGSN